MKRWALVVLGLYMVALAVLTVPVAYAAFAPTIMLSNVVEVYGTWQYWCWIAVMLLIQAALLVVPVRIASRRPVQRRSLLWPVVTGGLLAGALVFGAVCSILEFFFRDQQPKNWLGYSPFLAGIFLWAVWSVVFFRASRGVEPADVVSRQCRLLFKGSILELLIAIPTHIVARSRDYCCAGFMTFLGLTFGISVMLFSFGPAILFLYVERWRRLHPTVDR